MEQTITLELTAAEVNTILGAIAQRPFAEVANLFGKIQQQAQAQFKPEEEQQPAE